MKNAKHISLSMCYCRHKMHHLGKDCSIFRRTQNTGNTMSCFKNISDTMRQEEGTSRTEVPV